MRTKPWFATVLGAAMFVGLAACQPTQQSAAVPSAAEEGATAGAAAVDQGAADLGTAVPGGREVPEAGQPMVASGSATLPPMTPATQVPRPQPESGIQRAVSIDEARAGVPFTLLEATRLPADADLTMVQLISPAEGKAAAGLPAVRMIYDMAGELLVIYQSPASGATALGDPVTVGNHDGYLQATDQVRILTWEQDGVRVEMRASGLDRDALIDLAGSMAAASG